MDYTPYRACCYCVKIKDIKNREPPALCIPVFGPLIAFIPSPESLISRLTAQTGNT
jgi:hypothetical protein